MSFISWYENLNLGPQINSNSYSNMLPHINFYLKLSIWWIYAPLKFISLFLKRDIL